MTGFPAGSERIMAVHSLLSFCERISGQALVWSCRSGGGRLVHEQDCRPTRIPGIQGSRHHFQAGNLSWGSPNAAMVNV